MNENNENHVFIVGLPRTGTTIMYRTVQKLPNFQSIRLNLAETGIFRNNITFDTPDLYYQRLLRYIFQQRDVYDEFLDAVKKYTRQLQEKKENNNYEIELTHIKARSSFNKLELADRNRLVEARWKQSCRYEIIKEYFKYARECRQGKRIVEKTPHHYINTHQILWTFPNARILWMIRHPIDIITSSIKRDKIDENYHNYWDADNFIREFKGSFLRYNYYKHVFEKNIILIKYEDFVNDPANEFKKICDFINEPFCHEALIIKDHEILKWKSADTYLFSRIVNKTEKKWQEHLSMEDTEKIETALKELMVEYGFDFYSPKKKK
jgi:hypothetical protein